MRDLPGAHGYGRARGTENIDRPDQTARATALSLRIDDIARGSGIDLERDERKADPSGLPSITGHADGGVTMTLGAGWTSGPSTPDLFEEATAVAIGRAYQLGRPGQDRAARATIAGIIAGHQLVQNAGLKTIAATHGETVSDWRRQVKSAEPETGDRETRAVIELAGRTETDLALPRTDRQKKRWNEHRAARIRSSSSRDEHDGTTGRPSPHPDAAKRSGEAAPVRRAGTAPGGDRPHTAPRRGPGPRR